MDERTQRRNRRVLVGLLVLVVGMIGMAYASVPLYTIFCRATGLGGTTQRADGASAKVLDRTVTVRFNADVNGALPWSFRPNQRSVTVKLGETALISYHAVNHGTAPITGTAVFNVTPDKAGLYFDKIQCFCFTEQRLEPGQEADLPVSFFVDPAIADDLDARDIDTITLSYTFFRAKDAAPGEARATTKDQKAAERPNGATAVN